MFEPHSSGRFGNPLWLVVGKRGGLPFFHRTKTARSRTDFAQDHERGRLLRPAFHLIGTFGALANRFQGQIFDHSGGEMVAVAAWELASQPGRQPLASWQGGVALAGNRV